MAREDPTPELRTQRRLLEQRSRALTKTHEVAEEKLERATLELKHCGPMRRRRRGALVAEIDLQRRAIAMTNEQLSDVVSSLEDLRRQALGADRRPERDAPELSRAAREDRPIAMRLER